MIVNIKGQEIDLRYTLRTNVLYETIMGKALDYTALEQITVVGTLFYANILATLQANKIEMNISYDEYMDWLDQNNGLQKLNEYATWLSEQLQMQFKLIPTKEEVEEVVTKKKRKKN